MVVAIYHSEWDLISGDTQHFTVMINVNLFNKDYLQVNLRKIIHLNWKEFVYKDLG